MKEATKSSFVGEGKGLAIKKKKLFLRSKKIPQKIWPLSSREGGGGKALVAGQLKKDLLFFEASRRHMC